MKPGLNTLGSDDVKVIAKQLGVKPEEVVEMETRLGGQDVALEPGGAEDDDHNNYGPITYLAAEDAEPVYLRVPPGHRKHWAKFCGRYDACGRPVLFVRDEWYTNTYVPRYREHYHGGGYRQPVRVVERVEYRDYDRGHGGRRWEEHGRGHGEGHGRGHGEGHGNGHGRGHD